MKLAILEQTHSVVYRIPLFSQTKYIIIQIYVPMQIGRALLFTDIFALSVDRIQ